MLLLDVLVGCRLLGFVSRLKIRRGFTDIHLKVHGYPVFGCVLCVYILKLAEGTFDRVKSVGFYRQWICHSTV